MLLRNRAPAQSSNGKALGTPLVNGSRGVVTGFVESTSSVGGLVPRVCFDNGQEVTVGPVEYINKGPGAGECVCVRVCIFYVISITISSMPLHTCKFLLTN